MRHAYLIIAHNEFRVLESLLKCLDDSRNTIFLHIDKKVKARPYFTMSKSRLVILDNRIDVRWGDISQIECELALIETAISNGPFDRYTLLSGVHMPLKSQDEIFSFLDSAKDAELLAPVPNSDVQEELKMHKWSFFLRWYSSSVWIQKVWRLLILLQDAIGLRKNSDKKYYISSQWFSITDPAAALIAQKKKSILSEFKYSFCADEWFIRTTLERSQRKDHILITDKLLFCMFDGAASPKVLSEEDYRTMMNSDCLFARKFSEHHIAIVDRLLNESLNTD
ncbi:MAG: beta-1,6-N-acetylglucosaminyltransferase [Bacteroidales bacterium]|nr:beta-1,6-N-acetylglucosaminyltransferase [Bacteroidales bacterium]